MNRKEKEKIILTHISNLFDIDNESGKKLVQSIVGISDDELNKISQLISGFQHKHKNDLKDLIKKLDSGINKIEELKEKRDFLQEDDNFFNKI